MDENLNNNNYFHILRALVNGVKVKKKKKTGQYSIRCVHEYFGVWIKMENNEDQKKKNGK